ncbi:ASCH domain-containing protein [Pseudovibrio exalbescens]|uniref:ASCH domain-containing protein n=1 Tax=Pseudovibrio exalbescens TaxID=197461 RepID=A0A1U7JJW9_9HYPH|nr:hypothetical protein [Pseudovibrio exalbescens]OKL45033.1 hypothetical protein A3843_05460 [Pseudovibrio exalbescens]
MPRNMSFALTKQQIINRKKTVTRRFGWAFLKPGTVLNAVEKGMGLKPGEKVKRLCQIRVVSVQTECLKDISQEDCAREGFPEYSPEDFVRMFADHHKRPPESKVNRIEFEYLEDCPYYR